MKLIWNNKKNLKNNHEINKISESNSECVCMCWKIMFYWSTCDSDMLYKLSFKRRIKYHPQKIYNLGFKQLGRWKLVEHYII